MTIEKAYRSLLKSLETIYEEREAKSIARIVFEEVFQISNFKRQDELSTLQFSSLTEIEKRLLTHEPVQYVLGVADFFGLKFKVDKHVLIPRQETEELVFWILEEMREIPNFWELRVLDIGTGSGCIPIALKNKRQQWKIDALDVSPDALKIARENAKLNKTEIHFFQVDILKEAQWSEINAYNIIVSNPPYIPKKEKYRLSENVAGFEPHLALFVENDDPLLFYKKISRLAFLKLKPNGKLFFETNEFNAEEVLKTIVNQGFKNCRLKKDLSGKNRMICAEK